MLNLSHIYFRVKRIANDMKKLKAKVQKLYHLIHIFGSEYLMLFFGKSSGQLLTSACYYTGAYYEYVHGHTS